MKYLIILGLCILATSKILLQSRLAKNINQSIVNVLFLNGMIFFFAALSTLYSLNLNMELPLLVFAFLWGISNVLFQLFYVLAFSSGSVSITVFIVNASMIIPTFLSAIIYKESLSFVRFFGIILTVYAFYMNMDRSNISINTKWLMFAFLAFIFNSTTVMTQKIYTKAYFVENSTLFVSLGFSFSTVFCLILLLFFNLNKKKCFLKFNFKSILISCMVGLILGFFQILNTYATHTIEGTILFPLYNGGTLIFSTIASIVLYKEKLIIKQKIGMLIGIIAIIFMCI